LVSVGRSNKSFKAPKIWLWSFEETLSYTATKQPYSSSAWQTLWHAESQEVVPGFDPSLERSIIGILGSVGEAMSFSYTFALRNETL